MKTLRAATLGMRLSRPRDYVSCARYFGIAILTMMAVLSVLVLISAQQISQRQQDVVDARTPQQAEVSRPTPSLLSSETTNNWAGANVTIVSIAGGHEFPQTRPPGINRNPADGEAFASPAFLRALTSSHVLRLALGQAKIVGKIEATGLRGPTEMRLIKGIPLTARSQDDMTHTQKFGATGERLVDLSGPLGFVLPLAVVIAFAPMLLALLLVSRLRAPETGHRFAVLRAVGLDRTSTRVIAVGELAPPAVLGGLLAWLGFTLISQRLTHLPWTTFSFWSRDTHVPVTVQVLVIIGCVLFTTVVAAFTAGGGRATSTRPSSHEHRPNAMWLIAVAASALCLGYSLWLVDDPAKAKRYAIAAVALFMVGFPATAHWLLRGLSVLISRRAANASTLIGGRRLGQAQGATFRLALALALGVLAVGSAMPFVQTLKTDPRQGMTGLASAHGYNLFVGSSNLSPREARDLPGARTALATTDAQDSTGSPIPILYASCRQLASIVTVRGCSGKPQWINIRGTEQLQPTYETPITRVSGGVIAPDLPASTVYAPVGAELQGGILLTRRSLAGTPDGLLINLRDGLSSLDSFEAALGATAPTAFYTNGYQDQIDQAKQNLALAQMAQLAAGLGLAGLAIALIAAGLRNVMERRRQSRVLGILGASQRTKTQIHILAQAAPILTCTYSAAAATTIIWTSLTAIDPATRLPPDAYITLATVPAVLATLLTAVTLPAAVAEPKNPTTSSDIRLWS